MSLEAFAAELRAAGLDLVGVATAASARSCCRPPAGSEPPIPSRGSVLVCGSGGRAHWRALPEPERRQPHPIHHHARRVTAAALRRLGPDARQLDDDALLQVDLRQLAATAGWGTVSPYLHLLIHPVYGPWVSIRTVVVTAADLAPTPADPDYEPCRDCPRPCLDACPAGAYGRGHDWQFVPCAEHRLRDRAPSEHCDDGCRSRLACVVGTEHAYGPDEYRHRHHANLDDIRRHLEPYRRR